MTLYDILGVTPDVSSEQIKKSFRKLSKKYHPDVSSEKSVDYVKIIEAYKILIDEKKRKEYNLKNGIVDTFQSESLKNNRNGIFIIPNSRIEYSLSLENLLKNKIKIATNFKHKDYQFFIGQDIVIYIKPMELKSGAAAILEFPARMVCPACLGRKRDCYRCHGTHYIKTVEKIFFHIPRNVKNGDILEINPRDYTKNAIHIRSHTIKIRINIIED